jgi:hypothetical protein
VSHTQPISLYASTSELRTGRPHAVAYRNEDGQPRIRIHPAGIGGPYLSLSPGDWDVLVGVVADARADAAAATTLPGELPSAHLGRTVAGA